MTLFRRFSILFRRLFFSPGQRCVLLSSRLTNQSTSWRLYRKVSESLLCSYLSRKVVRVGALIAENSGRNRRNLRFLPPWHSVDLQNNFATADTHTSAVYRPQKDHFPVKLFLRQRFSLSFAAFSMLRMVCKYSSSTGERFCA